METRRNFSASPKAGKFWLQIFYEESFEARIFQIWRNKWLDMKKINLSLFRVPIQKKLGFEKKIEFEWVYGLEFDWVFELELETSSNSPHSSTFFSEGWGIAE